jgi:ribosomal protein L29
MAKKVDYKNHSTEDLTKAVADKREEFRALRFSVAGSKNRDVKAAGKLKREIARILTAKSAKNK